MAFGYKFASLGPWASGEIEFSIFSIIAYFLPSFGSVYLIVRKRGYHIAVLSFVLSAILLSLVPFFTTVTVSVLGDDTSVNIDWASGVGLTLAILFSVFALMISLYIISYGLVNIKKEKQKVYNDI